MNRLPENQPLSLELLASAVIKALRRPAVVRYDEIVLNVDRWLPIIQQSGATYLYGMRIVLMHGDDISAMLASAFGKYHTLSLYDYSVFLRPESHFDQKTIRQVDLAFAITAQVEEILLSGEVTVIPAAHESACSEVATVDPKCPGRDKLHDLLVENGHDNAYWRLPSGFDVQVDGWTVRIYDKEAHSNDEVSVRLAQCYNVKVATEGLRKRAEQLLEYAVRHEQRATRLEQLNVNDHLHPPGRSRV
jgi:hypothetical protein